MLHTSSSSSDPSPVHIPPPSFWFYVLSLISVFQLTPNLIMLKKLHCLLIYHVHSTNMFARLHTTIVHTIATLTCTHESARKHTLHARTYARIMQMIQCKKSWLKNCFYFSHIEFRSCSSREVADSHNGNIYLLDKEINGYLRCLLI